MRTGEWTLRSRCVVTPGGIVAADVLIRGEAVAEVATHGAPDREGVILDVGSRAVLPGLVALQIHPQGEEQHPLELATITRAAAAGGVTTIVGIPGPTAAGDPSPNLLDSKLFALSGKIRVDCGFFGRLGPGDASGIEHALDSGILGLAISFGATAGQPPSSREGNLEDGLRACARLNRPVLIHVGPPGGGGHPEGIEARARAIRDWLGFARASGCRRLAAHASTGDAWSAVDRADPEGRLIRIQTLPSSRGRRAGPGTTHGPGDQEPGRFWEGLRSGRIDGMSWVDASSTEGPGGEASPGTGPLSLLLASVWAEASRRGAGLEDVARWTARRPADLAGLSKRKGSIAPGKDADFAVFDGGRVEATILRGRLIYASGRLHGQAGGVPILRLEETLPMTEGLDRLNRASPSEATAMLLRGCGSTRWVARLLELRPFCSEVDLLDSADRVWETLERSDRLEAYAASSPNRPSESAPEGTLAIPARFLGQPSPDESLPEILDAIHQARVDYRAKFGHGFVTSRPDRPFAEQLSELRERMANEPVLEEKLASAEQAEIARLELKRLVGP